MNNRSVPLMLAVAALVAVSIPGAASAATSERLISQLAGGICGANNPANDPSLRRLTTGLRNTAAGNVSVVCNQWGDDRTAAVVEQAVVWFKNDRTSAYPVTCTLSIGSPYYGQVSSTKTVTVAAGGYTYLLWSTADYGTDPDLQWLNVQCSLPQAFSMREIDFIYDEAVGS